MGVGWSYDLALPFIGEKHFAHRSLGLGLDVKLIGRRLIGLL